MKKINYNDIGCGRKLTKGYSSGHLCGVADGWGKEHFCEECKKIEKALWRKDNNRYKEERDKKQNYFNINEVNI